MEEWLRRINKMVAQRYWFGSAERVRPLPGRRG